MSEAFNPITYKVTSVTGEAVLQTVNTLEELDAFGEQVEALLKLGQIVGDPEIVKQ
jgi:hypothetical protein